jgi:hypothetical protein
MFGYFYLNLGQLPLSKLLGKMAECYHGNRP